MNLLWYKNIYNGHEYSIQLYNIYLWMYYKVIDILVLQYTLYKIYMNVYRWYIQCINVLYVTDICTYIIDIYNIYIRYVYVMQGKMVRCDLYINLYKYIYHAIIWNIVYIYRICIYKIIKKWFL